MSFIRFVECDLVVHLELGFEIEIERRFTILQKLEETIDHVQKPHIHCQTQSGQHEERHHKRSQLYESMVCTHTNWLPFICCFSGASPVMLPSSMPKFLDCGGWKQGRHREYKQSQRKEPNEHGLEHHERHGEDFLFFKHRIRQTPVDSNGKSTPPATNITCRRVVRVNDWIKSMPIRSINAIATPRAAIRIWSLLNKTLYLGLFSSNEAVILPSWNGRRIVESERSNQ